MTMMAPAGRTGIKHLLYIRREGQAVHGPIQNHRGDCLAPSNRRHQGHGALMCMQRIIYRTVPFF